MIGSEAERQFYLGRAGIRIWYARKPLPGAAPSPDFHFPAEPASPQPEPGDRPLSPVPARPLRQTHPRSDSGRGKHRIAGIQALMAENLNSREGDGAEAPGEHRESQAERTDEAALPGHPQLGGAASQPGAPDASPAAPELAEADVHTQVSANLGYWVSGNLVLVSGFSDEASDRLQDALALNILLSLGESRIEKRHTVRWPVFGNPRVPGNGMDDLRDILKSLGAESGPRQFVLLGVLQGGLPSERSVFIAHAFGEPVIDFPHSLAELAAVPDYKRSLWQQLKPISGA